MIDKWRDLQIAVPWAAIPGWRADMARDRLVFPIGQCGGRIGAADAPEAQYRVRIGTRTFTLPNDRFTGWVAGHGSPSLPDGAMWTLTAATHTLAAMGAADAAAVLDGLRADGLLDEVDLADAVGFAQRYRLAPLLLGLGDSAQAPGGYPIGLPDLPMLALSRPLNAIWEWADTTADLWAACQRFAEAEREFDDHDPRMADPPRVLEDLLGELHGLLQGNAAYLDLAQPQGGSGR